MRTVALSWGHAVLLWDHLTLSRVAVNLATAHEGWTSTWSSEGVLYTHPEGEMLRPRDLN